MRRRRLPAVFGGTVAVVMLAVGGVAGTSRTDDLEAAAQADSSSVEILHRIEAPGTTPSGVTWDGSALWVIDSSGSLFRVDAQSGALTGFQPPAGDGAGPPPLWGVLKGITWSGSAFHVYIGSSAPRSVQSFTIVDGLIRIGGKVPSPIPVGVAPFATNDLAWVDGKLWVAGEFVAQELDAAGNLVSSFTSDKELAGLDWDGSVFWTAQKPGPAAAMTLRRMDRTGKVLACVNSPASSIDGLAWAGDALWALGRETFNAKPTLFRLDVSKVREQKTCGATAPPTTATTGRGPVTTMPLPPAIPGVNRPEGGGSAPRGSIPFVLVGAIGLGALAAVTVKKMRKGSGAGPWPLRGLAVVLTVSSVAAGGVTWFVVRDRTGWTDADRATISLAVVGVFVALFGPPLFERWLADRQAGPGPPTP